MNETVIFNRFGRAAYRLCDRVFYDYVGKPRGFLVDRTVYDQRGQHRGFYVQNVLSLPQPDIPPVPYKNLPAPEPPSGVTDMTPPTLAPIWSMMRLENLLV